jgi:formiminotetrahydrofolate cyclodeaminase
MVNKTYYTDISGADSILATAISLGTVLYKINIHIYNKCNMVIRTYYTDISGADSISATAISLGTVLYKINIHIIRNVIW